MTTFQYLPEIFDYYPNLRSAVILGIEMKNGPCPKEFLEEFEQEQKAALLRLGDRTLSEVESLSAWRKIFRSFNVDPTKYRSAPEALLRRLMKKGNIPSVNLLVDICNLISIRYFIAVAAFDTKSLHGTVTVRFADGSEIFSPLGSDEVEYPEIGEVIFSDANSLVIARRWCWRQSIESAASLKTRSAIFTIEAQHSNADKDVASATADLLDFLIKYAGGTYTSKFLNSDTLSISNQIIPPGM